MKEIKGPAIFLAQFMRDEAPYNSLDSICEWVSGLGYKGVQIPTNDIRCMDLDHRHHRAGNAFARAIGCGAPRL